VGTLHIVANAERLHPKGAPILPLQFTKGYGNFLLKGSLRVAEIQFKLKEQLRLTTKTVCKILAENSDKKIKESLEPSRDLNLGIRCCFLFCFLFLFLFCLFFRYELRCNFCSRYMKGVLFRKRLVY